MKAALKSWNSWLAAAIVLAVVSRAPADEAAVVPPSRWYKGNLHAHSLWSDGNDFPEMIADWYRKQGYHFLAITEHDILSEGERWMALTEIEARRGRSIYDYRNNGWKELPEGDPRKKPSLEKYVERFGADWVETRGDKAAGTLEVRLRPLDEYRHLVEKRDSFVLLAGEEISDSVEKLPVHLNAIHLTKAIPASGGATVRQAIEANLRAAHVQSQQTGREILVQINHPNDQWAMTAEDLVAIESAQFFEIYNGHPGTRSRGDEYHASTEEIWDIANTLRIGQLRCAPLYGVASDDAHHFHGEGYCWPGRGWLIVKARQLTPEALIGAMKQGDFYASTGVALTELVYSPTSKTLELSIEPNGDAEFTTRFIGTLTGFNPASEPRRDDQGRELATTRRYSRDVGAVLATVKGLHAKYRLTGSELYVRAVVTSTELSANPSFPGQVQQAWTQPVGWQSHVPSDRNRNAAER